MTATSHAVTGAMIATLVRQPILALPLSFISHFICDSLPHFGIDLKWGGRAMYSWLAIDGWLAVLAAVFLVIMGVENPVLLAVCGFLAMSPDLAWLYYGLNGKLGKLKEYDPLTRLHHKIQWYQKVPGIVIEAVWVTAMLFIILGVQ